MDLLAIFHRLLAEFGPQGWWPLTAHSGSNPTKRGSHSGYHPGDYSFPKTQEEQFEIAVGAVLTQNTAWTNVEMALRNLADAKALHNPKSLLNLPKDQLQKAIRPAGYFNQKSEYLHALATFFTTCNEPPTRQKLLDVRGIGEETADAILLYAFSVPTFVIDAYTKRFLLHRGILSGNEPYKIVQQLFHDSLPHNTVLFQEFHALLVELGKRYYSKKPYGDHIDWDKKDGENYRFG